MLASSCIHFFNKININFIIRIFGSVVLRGTQDAIASISSWSLPPRNHVFLKHLIKQLRSLNHMSCPAQLQNQSIQSNRMPFWHHKIYTLGIIHTSKILNINCQNMNDETESKTRLSSNWPVWHFPRCREKRFGNQPIINIVSWRFNFINLFMKSSLSTYFGNKNSRPAYKNK